MNTALFRCDASKDIGTGHVVRCLTLAQALRDKAWDCAFAASDETISLMPMISQSGFKIIGTDEILGKYDLAVVDGYQFNAGHEKTLAEHARKILVIDDLADKPHAADIIVDQTFGRSADDYKPLVPNHCKILTGADYALLRSQFAQARDETRAQRQQRNGKIENIMLFISGSDRDGVTLKALQGVAKANGNFTCDVIINPAAAIYAEAKKIKQAQLQKFRFHHNVSDMAAMMAKADLCVGSSGTASWERCCLGLPAVVIEIADNQRLIAQNLADAGAIRNLGWFETIAAENIAKAIEEMAANPQGVQAMSAKAAQICDGQGAQRIVKTIEEILAL